MGFVVLPGAHVQICPENEGALTGSLIIPHQCCKRKLGTVKNQKLVSYNT